MVGISKRVALIKASRGGVPTLSHSKITVSSTCNVPFFPHGNQKSKAIEKKREGRIRNNSDPNRVVAMEKGGEEAEGRRRKGGIKMKKASKLKMGEIKNGVGGLLLIGGALLAAKFAFRFLKRRRVVAREASKGSGRIMNGTAGINGGGAHEEEDAKSSSQPKPPSTVMVSPSRRTEAIDVQQREKRVQEREEANASGGSSLEDSSEESNMESRWPAEASESSTTSLEECCMKHQQEPKAFAADGLKAMKEDGVAEEARMTVVVADAGEKKRAGRLLSKGSRGLLGLGLTLMVGLVMLMVVIHSLQGRGVDALHRIYRAVFRHDT